MDQAPQPFSTRLQALLDGITPPRTQAWLAEESGIPASTVSRLLRGDRPPTPVVIESLAPALGVEPAFLVKGTDAEARFLECGDWIKKATYEAAIKKLADCEARINRLDGEHKMAKEGHTRETALRKDLEGQLSHAHLHMQWARRDLDEAREQNVQLQADRRRYQQGLAAAVAEVGSLREKLNVLADELASTKKSSRASAILAGVAAAAGVVTVAQFLSQDDGAHREAPAPSASRKKTTKRAKE